MSAMPHQPSSLLRRVNQRFGRVGPSHGGVAPYLGDATTPTPPAPTPTTPTKDAAACTFSSYLEDQAWETPDGRLSLKHHTTDATIAAALGAGGGVAGALLAGRPIAGAMLGLGTAAAVVALRWKKWRAAGGCP